MFNRLFKLTIAFSIITLNVMSAVDADWSVNCPQIVDVQPTSAQPLVTGFSFTGTGQRFTRLGADGRTPVSASSPVVGCYASLSTITGPEPGWQLGVIGRDGAGFYWLNAAGRKWRLILDNSQRFFQTGDDAPYKDSGDQFQLLPKQSSYSDCKAEDIALGGVRTGFPKVSTSVKSIGISKNLLVVVDFADETWQGTAIGVANELSSPQTIERFFELNAYGQLDLQIDIYPDIVRLQKSASTYFPVNGSGYVNGEWQDQKLTKDLVRQIEDLVNFSNYESVNIVVAPARKELSFGGASPGIRISTSSGVVRNSSVVGRGILKDATVPGWKVIAHELGHLLGFADFYIPGNGNTGKSPGPFDIMANTTGTSHSFFGWHRWMQGWLTETEIICDTSGKSTSPFTLQTLMGNQGQRLYISRLSATRLLLAEMRTDTEFDKLGAQAGVLFYVLDLETPTLQGPVTVLQSVEDKPTSWTNDVERYSTATATLGQTVRFENRVFRVSKISSSSAQVDVFTAEEYETYVKSVSRVQPVIQVAGKKCPKVGQTRSTLGVKYRCTRIGSKLAWKKM